MPAAAGVAGVVVAGAVLCCQAHGPAAGLRRRIHTRRRALYDRAGAGDADARRRGVRVCRRGVGPALHRRQSPAYCSLTARNRAATFNTFSPIPPSPRAEPAPWLMAFSRAARVPRLPIALLNHAPAYAARALDRPRNRSASRRALTVKRAAARSIPRGTRSRARHSSAYSTRTVNGSTNAPSGPPAGLRSVPYANFCVQRPPPLRLMRGDDLQYVARHAADP